MSELKVIKIELNNHGKPIASIQGTTSYYGISPNDKFYQQDEADKVIAEKDAMIAELQKQVHDYAQGLYVIQARADKEVRHQKRKRCLAMARWCSVKTCYYIERLDKCSSCTRSSYYKTFYEKWYKRWLDIAEKFKEAK